MIKLASLAYVPPPSVGCGQTFYDNLRQHKTTEPLILYSDHNWPEAIRIGNPEVARQYRDDKGQPNKFAVNNLIFLTGLRLASKLGLSHIIYLESDCRVGRDHWDGVMFQEYFNFGFPAIAAGTLACYNPSNHSREANLRWAELVSRNWKRNVPVATYGWLAADKRSPTCVFPNGALSVLNVAWMATLFNLDNTAAACSKIAPWDMQMGLEIWQRFGVDSFTVCGYLESIYSGYGEILTTEEERLKMLAIGKVVAVHQVKSNASV